MVDNPRRATGAIVSIGANDPRLGCSWRSELIEDIEIAMLITERPNEGRTARSRRDLPGPILVQGRTDGLPLAAHGTLDPTLLRAPLALTQSWTHLGDAWFRRR